MLRKELEPGNVFLSSEDQEKFSQLKELFVNDKDEEKIIQAIRKYKKYNVE
jgi:hypothetical protein